MLVFIGDTHGAFEWLPTILAKVPRDAILIQVGDFGFWHGRPKKMWLNVWEKLEFENPMLVIDGNHEYHPMFEGISEPTEIWPGAKFVPRGTVMDISDDGANKKVGFMGGASSVDYKSRTLGANWFLEENISSAELMRMNDVDYVDILVTHTPPNNVIQKCFSRSIISDYGLPPSWIDPSAVAIEELSTKLGNPPIVCGHMHVSMIEGTVRVLDINEIFMYRRWF